MPDPFATPVVDPFMGGGSPPGLTFKTVGETHAITVREVTERTDTEPDGTPRTWASGEPKKVFIFTGEGEDGEPCSLWVRGNMVTAIREATKAAGLTTVVDTKLTVKFDSEGTPPSRGMNAPKLFKAKVEKVAPAPATAGPFDEEF